MSGSVFWRRKNARRYISSIGELRWRDGWMFHPKNGREELRMWYPTLELAKREAEKAYGALVETNG